MSEIPMVGRRFTLPEHDHAYWREKPRVFEQLFSAAIETLPRLFWLVWDFQSGPLDMRVYEDRSEEWVDQLWIDVPSSTRGGAELSLALMRPQFLPGLSRYVFSDWVDILGLPCSEEEAFEFAEEFAQRRWRGLGRTSEEGHDHWEQDLITANGLMYLTCCDAAYWDCWITRARAASFWAAIDPPDAVRVEELTKFTTTSSGEI